MSARCEWLDGKHRCESTDTRRVAYTGDNGKPYKTPLCEGHAAVMARWEAEDAARLGRGTDG